MFDALVTALALVGAASLIAFALVCLLAVLDWRRERRWRREYERELAEAEENLSRDLERWRWIETSALPRREPW